MVASSGSDRVDSHGRPALLTELLPNMPGPVAYVAGPDLVFQFANKEYLRIFAERDLIGQPLREAVPELTPERLAMVEQVAKDGQPIGGRESEMRIRRPGHEPEQMFVDFAYKPVPDGAGGVAGVLMSGHDVTQHVRDRRRLEALTERLATSQERYRTLFETLPLGVVHRDGDGSILGANPAAGEILGLPPKAMTTWPIDPARRAVHEDGSPYKPDELPAVIALRTGKVVADVVAGVRHGRTGDLRWLRVTAVPDASDEQGRPQRAYAMFADITEQHRAQAALRESNRLLARLRDANIIGVAVLTEAGVREANDAYLDIIGYSRDDLESGRIHFRAITPPEWAAADDDAVDQLRRAGVARPFEKEYVHRDGHRVPILVGAAVVDWHPLRWTSFVVDLTARQRREQERQALLERVQGARKEADTARERLAFLLQAGDMLAGTDSGGDLLEQVSQLVDVATTGTEDRIVAGRDATEARRAHMALRALNAELEERVSRRTSELVRAEADRRALEAELRQAERMQTVGQLTSSIAHDFGNLLAVVVGYAEMAEDVTAGGRDPELRRILAEIRGAADRAVRLSSDLLQLSRRTRAKREEIDLNELVARIKDLLTVSMSGRGEVRFQQSAVALPAVLADRGQLEQVLLNLAVNARDAMPDGGTLTISTGVVDFGEERARLHPGTHAGRYVELAVQDTGVGMNADVQARIFERFFTTKPEGTGTGLGLSTVHGIVTGLGGVIELSSLEGCGTTFRIYVPTMNPGATPPPTRFQA
jgi:PAS domain S-box-containing protein